MKIPAGMLAAVHQARGGALAAAQPELERRARVLCIAGLAGHAAECLKGLQQHDVVLEIVAERAAVRRTDAYRGIRNAVAERLGQVVFGEVILGQPHGRQGQGVQVEHRRKQRRVLRAVSVRSFFDHRVEKRAHRVAVAVRLSRTQQRCAQRQQKQQGSLGPRHESPPQSESAPGALCARAASYAFRARRPPWELRAARTRGSAGAARFRRSRAASTG
jgi:hypothetical protein